MRSRQKNDYNGYITQFISPQGGSMAFTIIFILIFILYVVLLDLFKNIVLGFFIALAFFVAMLFFRFKFLKQIPATKVPEGLIKALAWVVFLLLLVLNYNLTRPPYKRVPAVSNKKPAVTEVISLSQGDLTGVYNEDHSVAVYAGIPYAAPPVGNLRFREPQLPSSWEGVRKCDKFAPMAMQERSTPLMDSLTQIVGFHDYKVKLGDEYIEPMSEDCLYLNVFAPGKRDNDALVPVIFYIHGGSLKTGQPSYSEYRGEDLAKKGVVVVNFGYRLNVFGFYAAEDLKKESVNGTTGNYGILDQIAALNWVRENIAAFGGDPEQITIAGESAGSSCVNALCVSPLSDGLFNYAIAASSAVTAKKPYHTFRSYEEALEQGDIVREDFGVSDSKSLRSIPAEDLLHTTSTQTAMTIDGYVLKKYPYLSYQAKENHEKALLHGFNAKEADVFLLGTKATAKNYEELLSEIAGDYATELAQVVPANSPKRDQHILVDAGGSAKGALNTCYSAAWFSYSHHLWNSYLVKEKIPSYEYIFTKTNKSLSNYHAGELPYAYGNLWRHPDIYENEDFELSEIMQSYWVNFAKTGDPNGQGLPTWEVRTPTQTKLLELGSDIHMTEDPNEAIYKVLDKYQND